MAKKLISKVVEDYAKRVIFMELANGDPLWDVPHTNAVVYHLKQILQNSPETKGLDAIVLILAAYGHDWGYSNYYKPGQSLSKEEYMEAKKTHAQVSKEKMEKLLRNSIFALLTKDQKKRILHLILIHDDLNSLKNKDELVLMEADTLGGLDTDFITSTWTKEQDLNHMMSVRNKRLPHFVTTYGKHKFEECFKKRNTAANKR